MAVQKAVVASGMASRPNTTKNTNRVSATIVTRMAWLNTLTRPRFSRWRGLSGISIGSPCAGRPMPSAGVPATRRVTSAQSSKSFTTRIAAGTRDSMKAVPSTKNSASTTR